MIEFPSGMARWWEYVNKRKKAHQKWKKLPKIFNLPNIERLDEDARTMLYEESPANSVPLKFKLHFNKRISSFHDQVMKNKRNKSIPIDSPFTTNNQDRVTSVPLLTTSSRLIDTIKNLYLGRSNFFYNDASSSKCVKFTSNNSD
ncbi:hypothetical protein RCL_jg4903.t1 [Rhizophagus clarus]|uniref:Uncharacterized protein n=1 Tax=Rhizophagus clarus TaxID=94130 RepID=A0A8H3LAV9_9GLOM|nr:hypothetical protein RCL_jg4903.t1 [Rhizophagus clarus]